MSEWTFAQKALVVLAALRLPVWVFAFPNNAADGIFHLVSGTLFAVLAAAQLRENRMPQAAG